jgi:hypothetical protein
MASYSSQTHNTQKPRRRGFEPDFIPLSTSYREQMSQQPHPNVTLRPHQTATSAPAPAPVPEPEPEPSPTTTPCPICYEPISGNSTNFVRLKCTHVFCFDCINTSLKTNNTCPCCRDPIEPTKRNNPNLITMNDGVEFIKNTMADINWSNHADTLVHFMNDMTDMNEKRTFAIQFMKHNMRIMAMELVSSLVEYQNDDTDDDDEDDDDDYEEEE